MELSSKYGYCVDVMEHIPENDVDNTIKNIMNSSETVFFQISTILDNMGSLIGQQLHLTVKPLSWWKRKFESIGCRILHEEMTDIDCKLVVTRKE